MDRLKFSIQINPTLPPIGPGEVRDEVSFLPMENVGDDGSVNLSEVRPIEQVRKGYTPVANGDVVLAKITPCFENGKGALCTGFKNGVAYGTTELIVLRPSAHKISGGYLYWLTHSQKFRSDGESEMKGAAGQKRVPEMFVANYRVPISSPAEQHRIAAYLDKETGKIDRLVELRRRQIELLKEQRASLIQQAVTRGLDPSVKLKDSGVPWIGKIPDQWQVAPIRRFTTVKRGASPRPIGDPKYFREDGEYAWVRISDVTASSKYLESTEQRLSEIGASLSVKREPGDIFVSICATVGKPIITKIKCCIHDGFVWFYRMQIDQEFLFYLFTGGEMFKGLGNWGTQLNLNTDIISAIQIPVPPLPEQRRIAAYLDEETGKIDRLVSHIEASIEKLQEYRTALINECVNGQQRVPA